MDQEHKRSDWYTNNTENWYRTEPVPAAPESAKKPKKKRTATKATMIVVCVLVLVAASALIFSEDNRGKSNDSLSQPTGTPSTYSDIPQEVWDDIYGNTEQNPFVSDLPDSYGDGGYDEDFHDYFSDYYTASDDPQGSNLERDESAGGFELELVSSQGKDELTLKELYEKCVDSVVGIKASAEGNTTSYSWGTGIIMTSDGYILTNNHIIEEMDEAWVVFNDGTELAAKLVGEDPQTDLAVLKVRATGLIPAEFGISDELSVGDQVVAIGNPLGIELTGTMTNGIISAVSRTMTYDGRTMDLLQTNTALNEGNSGGPLFNMYGQVIGITNMKMSASYTSVTIEGIGFAIPSSFAKTIVDALLDEGEVSGRPGMGITVGQLPSDAAEHYGLPEGLYILSVSQGSDAEAQGIRAGDVLTHVNGIKVSTTQDVLDIRDQYSVGDEMTLTIYRDGETFDVVIELYDQNQIY